MKEVRAEARVLFKEIQKQVPIDEFSMIGLNRSAEIVDNELQTGGLSGAREVTGAVANEIRNLAKSIGIPDKALGWLKEGISMGAAMDELKGLAAKGLFDDLGGFGKDVSNQDRQILERVQASSSKTIEGNRKLIDYHRTIRTARIEAAKVVNAYEKYKFEQGETPTAHDIMNIRSHYQQQAIERISTMAGINAEGARNLSAKDHEIAVKEAAAEAKVQEAAAEAARQGRVGAVRSGAEITGGAIGRAARGAFGVGEAFGTRAREAIRGGRAEPGGGLGNIPAPAVDDPSYPGVSGPATAAPTGGWASRRQERNSGAQPQPQRIVGEDLDYSGLDYGGFKEGRGPLGMESLRGIVGQGARLAPGGIPVEAMRPSTNVEYRPEETQEQRVARNPAWRNKEAYEEWQRPEQEAWQRRVDILPPSAHPEMARQAGLADLDTLLPAMRERNREKDWRAASAMGFDMFDRRPMGPLERPPPRPRPKRKEARR